MEVSSITFLAAQTTPTGDDTKYGNPAHPFAFNLLGVRVPGIVISAYTAAGTVIGVDPNLILRPFSDHTSVLKTVEDEFGLPRALTQKDKGANSAGCQAAA